MTQLHDDKILGFWNERSSLGQLAGTNDFVLTEIEQRFLTRIAPPKSRVLDIGCGNGASLIRLARETSIFGIGFDFSEGMVKAARIAVELRHSVTPFPFIIEVSRRWQRNSEHFLLCFPSAASSI